MKLPIGEIKVGTRARKALGNIDELMESISTVGLLHPVVVDQDHVLIAGQRRLEAAKRLGWKHVETTVVGIEDAALALRAELEENRNRRALLPSEAIEAGMRLEALEKAAAAKRMLAGVNQYTEPCVKLSQASKGKTRDRVGEVIGMSGSTYECGKEILEAAESEPEKYGLLTRTMDLKGVHTAHRGLKMIRGDIEPPTIIREEDSPPGDYRELVMFLADAFKAAMVKNPWALEALRDGRAQWPDERMEVIESLELITSWARRRGPRLEVV